MNTIHRSGNRLDLVQTVRATVQELAKKPGYIHIDDIKEAINIQLPEHEKVTRRTIMLIVAYLVEKRQKVNRK